MWVRRAPRPALGPFIESLWVMDERSEPPAVATHREHVLPTGLMHVVFRLSDDRLRLFKDLSDNAGEAAGDALVGGARASFYIREVSRPLCSVGAQLRPGAAQALFGVPADELAECHTRLDDLWGHAAAASIREQLAECSSPARRLDVLEAVLAKRLPSVRGLHPAVAQALHQFTATSNIQDVVSHSGYSHRGFIALFLRSVGLTPKRYCRVLRFRHALQRVSAGNAWVDLAAAAGYSDQSHFNREFREFAGVTPGEYCRALPRLTYHVPISGDRR